MDIFEEICKIETTAECNFINDDDRFGFIDVLDYLKEKDRKTYDRLIKMYEEFYGKDNVFWKYFILTHHITVWTVGGDMPHTSQIAFNSGWKIRVGLKSLIQKVRDLRQQRCNY